MKGTSRLVEAAHVLVAVLEAQEEIVAGAALSPSFGFAHPRWRAERRLGLVEGDAFGDDGVIPSLDERDQARFQRPAPLPGQVGGVTARRNSLCILSAQSSFSISIRALSSRR